MQKLYKRAASTIFVNIAMDAFDDLDEVKVCIFFSFVNFFRNHSFSFLGHALSCGKKYKPFFQSALLLFFFYFIFF